MEETKAGPVLITVDGYEVTVLPVPPGELEPVFNGKKLRHLFEFEKEARKVTITKVIKKGKKKGQTITSTRTVTSSAYTDAFSYCCVRDTDGGWSNLSQDEMTELLFECDRFDLKLDGGCGLLKWNDETGTWEPWTRYDARMKNGAWKIPKDGIPCEPEPTGDDGSKLHWPHMIRCTKEHKWHLVAFELAKSRLGELTPGRDYTIEWMGTKFNHRGKEKIEPFDQPAVIVPHGSLRVMIPVPLRTFDGIKRVIEEIPQIEGLVAYLPGGNQVKIRRDGFKELSWPPKGDIGPLPITSAAVALI